MEQALEPLSSDRARIERIVMRLQDTDDTTERADLGSALVRAVARYEDTLERSLVPRFRGVVPDDELERQASRRHVLRDAMTVIHERTMHIDARNVHISDPAAFEEALDDVLRCVEEQLPAEERALRQLFAKVPSIEHEEIARSVAAAANHASERPHPPKSKLGRFVANAHVKLDHAVEDVSTPHHPGAGVIDDPVDD